MRKDERALRTLAQRFIQLPLPDHGGRAVLLQAFAQVGWAAWKGRLPSAGRRHGAVSLLPAEGARWPPLAPCPPAPQRERLDLGASLSLLVQLTEGLSAGQLQAFVAQLAAGMRRGTAQPTRTEQGEGGAAALAGGEPPGSDPARQSGAAGTALQELALELLPGFSPAKAGDLQALQEWTARVHSPLPPEVRWLAGLPACAGSCLQAKAGSAPATLHHAALRRAALCRRRHRRARGRARRRRRRTDASPAAEPGGLGCGVAPALRPCAVPPAISPPACHDALQLACQASLCAYVTPCCVEPDRRLGREGRRRGTPAAPRWLCTGVFQQALVSDRPRATSACAV